MSSDAWITSAIDRWRPIVYLARGERYRPLRLETYLSSCDLRQKKNGEIIHTAPLTNTIMSTTADLESTTTLQISNGRESIRFGTPTNTPIDTVPFYVRTKLIDNGSILIISYQFFFGFNGPYAIFGGLFEAGAHQADLEHINVDTGRCVLLDAFGRPICGCR